MEIIIKKKKIITVANGKVRNFYVGKGMEASIVATNQVAFELKKEKQQMTGVMTFNEDGRLVSASVSCTKGKANATITVTKNKK